VQVVPIKPTMEAPGTERLILNCNIMLSTSAFKLNLRRYDEEKERALKEANTRVAREREYSNKIMNPEDAKAGGGGGVEDKFIPEADLDRLLLEGEVGRCRLTLPNPS